MQTGSNNIQNDTVDLNFNNPFTTYGTNSKINKWTNRAFVNYKVNAKNVFQVGVQSDMYLLNLIDSAYSRLKKKYVDLRNFEGNTFLIQPYFQYQWRMSNRLQFNGGVHYQLLTLENQQNMEPRLGLGLNLTEKDRR